MLDMMEMTGIFPSLSRDIDYEFDWLNWMNHQVRAGVAHSEWFCLLTLTWSSLRFFTFWLLEHSYGILEASSGILRCFGVFCFFSKCIDVFIGISLTNEHCHMIHPSIHLSIPSSIRRNIVQQTTDDNKQKQEKMQHKRTSPPVKSWNTPA